MGPSDIYTVKIINGEQRMRVLEEAKCSALSVDSAPTLPDISAEKYITFEESPSTADLKIRIKDGQPITQ